MMKNKKSCLLNMSFLSLLLLSSCASIPKNTKPIDHFEVERYLGKWFEIARFDYRFEKNLNNVTAKYSFNNNGTIKVQNRGYDYVNNKWKTAIGKAKFRGDKNTAALKVSFFGPFYSGYNVIAIDKNYQYAMIAGKNLKYLWILSRTRKIPEEIKQDYLKKAQDLGYNTSKLIWVEHDKENLNY